MTGEELVYLAIGVAPVVVYYVALMVVIKRADRSDKANPYRILDNTALIGGIGGWVVGSGFFAYQRDHPISVAVFLVAYIVFLGVRFLGMRVSEEYAEYWKVRSEICRKIDQALNEDEKGTDA